MDPAAGARERDSPQQQRGERTRAGRCRIAAGPAPRGGWTPRTEASPATTSSRAFTTEDTEGPRGRRRCSPLCPPVHSVVARSCLVLWGWIGLRGASSKQSSGRCPALSGPRPLPRCCRAGSCSKLPPPDNSGRTLSLLPASSCASLPLLLAASTLLVGRPAAAYAQVRRNEQQRPASMTLEDYEPTSMLVTEEHPVPRARSPFVDIQALQEPRHGHLLGRRLSRAHRRPAPRVTAAHRSARRATFGKRVLSNESSSLTVFSQQLIRKTRSA
jgi:hypothetical protein